LLRFEELLVFGSADADHFDPKVQHFLQSLLTAVDVIGPGHRRNDFGVSDLFLNQRNKVRTVSGVAPRQHQRSDKAAPAVC
jgi:hypothetical protein